MNRAQYAEKLLNIIKGFPESINSGELYEGADFPEKDFKLHPRYSTDYVYPLGQCYYTLHVNYIGVNKKNIGDFRKHKDEQNCYVFSFSPENAISFVYKKQKVFSKQFNKQDADILCERVLPFIVSCGKDKSTIPLIVNDFPEYASFALNFMQEANRE